MRKKTGFLLSVVILLVFSQLYFATAKANSGVLSFSFNKSISREVFTNYLSRAVTLEGFCVNGMKDNLIFEEDLRMLRRIGAKFVASAAMMGEASFTSDELNSHFLTAQKYAEKVHEKDKEIILEAYLPEMFHKQAVENIKIPQWVFTAFQKPVQDRSFHFEAMKFPSGSSYNIGGEKSTLFIGSEETQLFFYYLICRYIDAGYEAVFLGNAPALLNDSLSSARTLQGLLNLCRQYAREKARRGLVFFDCKTTNAFPAIKTGEQLVTDFVTIPITALENKPINGVFTASINIDTAFKVSGNHPQGFSVQVSPVFLRFENYSFIGSEGKNNGSQKGCWGFNEITWLSLQPKNYRNSFLNESYNTIKSNQQYNSDNQSLFLQMPCKVEITEPNPDGYFHISLEYTKGSDFHPPFFNDFVEEDGLYTFCETEPCKITVTRFHRANRNGDGCPSGFDEENTIRTLFLGSNIPEVPELNNILLPEKYFVVEEESSSQTPVERTSSVVSSAKGNKAKSDTKKSSSTQNSNAEDRNSSLYSSSVTFSEGLSSFKANSMMMIQPESNLFALLLLSIFLVAGIIGAIYFIVRKK